MSPPKHPKITRLSPRLGVWYYVRRVRGRYIRRSLGLPVETTPVEELIAQRDSIDAIIDCKIQESGIAPPTFKEADFKRSPTGGLIVPSGAIDRMTLVQLLNQVLILREYRDKTVEAYGMSVRRFDRWAADYGILYIDQITSNALKQFCLDMREKGTAASTVKFTLAVIKLLFSIALDEELIDGENPVKKNLHRYVGKTGSRVRYLTPDQWSALLAAADDVYPDGWLPLMIQAAAYTGLRLGELLALKWTDVEDGTLVVRRSKSGRERRVPISPLMSPVLEELRHRNIAAQPTGSNTGVSLAAANVVRLPPPTQPVGYIFYDSYRRKPKQKRALPWVAWDKARDIAGLDDFHWHDLRHHAAYLFLQRGLDIYTLSKVLGHSSVATTEIYSHLATHDIKARVNSLYGNK